MIFFPRNMLVLASLLLQFPFALATSFVFPSATPTVTDAATPAWLPNGNGDDGYLTVRAEVKMPPVSCAALGKKGVIADILQEKMQIVASVKTSGFRTSLDGKTLPVATFDGRSDPGGCTGLNTFLPQSFPMLGWKNFPWMIPGH
jgi:hypothetical protein